MWRSAINDLIFLAAYLHFLEHHSLISKDEVASKLGLDSGKKSDQKTVNSIEEKKESETDNSQQKDITLGVDIEDYLHGLAQLPRELSRLAINCVRSGNYNFVSIINFFVQDLYNGFRLLNLRNDPLRRKFDAIKYDVQRIEEVLYDVEVRKLAPLSVSSSSSSSSSSSTPQDSSYSSDSSAS